MLGSVSIRFILLVQFLLNNNNLTYSKKKMVVMYVTAHKCPIHFFLSIQFHANCIDPWLRQQGTCPVCKFRMGSGRQGNRESESDDSDIV